MEGTEHPVGMRSLPLNDWAEAGFATRLTLGFGNPNTTAAAIAIAMMLLPALIVAPSPLRYLACVLWIVGSTALAMTASRGGLAALVLGILAWQFSSSSLRYRLALGGALAVAITIFLLSPAGERVVHAGGDRSITSRWSVLSKVPAMVAAAPDGWGAGRSAEAYHNWFQRIGDLTHFRHILSTHAVWLVEGGWFVRIAYLGLWFGGLAVLFPRQGEAVWLTMAFASWIAFGTAACFSHVGENLLMWVFPGLIGAAVIVNRVLNGVGFGLCQLLRGVFLGLVALVSVIFTGHIANGEGIRLKSGRVTLGKQIANGTEIDVAVTSEVVGLHFGQQIRAKPPRRDWIRYAWDADCVLSAPVVLLAGRAVNPLVSQSADGHKMVWINPPGVFPEQVLARATYRSIKILNGEFSGFTTRPWRVYFEKTGADKKGGDVWKIRGQAERISNAWERFAEQANVSI